jgi:hypothetical protein
LDEEKENKMYLPLLIQQQNLWKQQVMMNASTRIQVYRDACYHSMYEASDKYIAAVIN